MEGTNQEVVLRHSYWACKQWPFLATRYAATQILRLAPAEADLQPESEEARRRRFVESQLTSALNREQADSLRFMAMVFSPGLSNTLDELLTVILRNAQELQATAQEIDVEQRKLGITPFNTEYSLAMTLQRLTRTSLVTRVHDEILANSRE
jgi:hypothetical protein